VTYPFASLPENLAAFCARLRRQHRFRIGPRELHDAARALELTALLDERAVRDTLRPVLAASFDDVRVFDGAFDEFFRGTGGGAPPRDALAASSPSAEQPQPRSPDGAGTRAAKDQTAAGDPEEGEPEENADVQGALAAVQDRDTPADARLLRARYSPFEADGPAPDLQPVDREWREAAVALVSRVHAGLSRRWRPAARGPRFDLRRTLRGSLHTGGEVLMPRWRARPRRRPRFVLLVDGSRSMAAHAACALQTAVALASATPNVETFAFSTALRRVTREVRLAAAGERRHLRLDQAWGGGTAIGACLREFLRGFGERMLNRDTVVIIASDGLDVGDPDVLRDGMARLSRRSAAIVWLNPLLETVGYQPTALGMRLARPYVNTFAAMSDAAGLLRVARAIRIR
jgi:uncharacterized protein with von Willebrand factor type A (vWA) domain